MMMMMIMNCVCAIVDRRKTPKLISSRDHCQRSSPSRIFDTLRAGFEPATNLSSDLNLVELSCAVVITTTPRKGACVWNKIWSLKSLAMLKCEIRTSLHAAQYK